MWLQALGAATAIGSSVLGNVKSAKANNEAKALAKTEKAENRRWWNVKRSEDGMNKTYNQAILNKFGEQSAERLRNIKASNAVTGGTNERFAVAQEAEANAKANMLSDIASGEGRMKESQESAFRSEQARLSGNEQAQLRQEGQNIAAATASAAQAGMNLIGAAYAGKDTETKKK